MKVKRLISMQRLVGKVDNDFNISESDWIPRVAAWVIDALSQLKVLPMEKKRRELEVSERIALFPCEITTNDLRVFDKYGNEIINGADSKCNNVSGGSNSRCGKCGSSTISSTGGQYDTIGVTKVGAKDSAAATILGTVVSSPEGHMFYLNGNNIELNFDTDKIIVESYEVATYHDDYYDCEVPYIYDNGTLLEALSWYILFKYLSRGSTHPVYSIKSTSPYTNPFAQWTLLKSKAKTSVLNDMTRSGDEGWNNFFYNSTFLPRS
jgi:hypothetical protein